METKSDSVKSDNSTPVPADYVTLISQRLGREEAYSSMYRISLEMIKETLANENLSDAAKLAWIQTTINGNEKVLQAHNRVIREHEETINKRLGIKGDGNGTSA